MKTFAGKIVAAAFCAVSLGPFFAPGGAIAGEVLNSVEITHFGAIVFKAGEESASFAPADPPQLLEFRMLEDCSVEIAGAGSDGKEQKCSFFIVDAIDPDGSPMCVFAASDSGPFLFVCEEMGLVQVSICPGEGLVLIPFDVGDTREARAAELASGNVPQMNLSRLSEIDQWLAARLGGGASRAATALDAVKEMNR